MALYALAMVAWAERDHQQAREMFEEGLTLSAEVGDETNVAYYLEGLASIAGAEGKVVRAVRLWGAAEALLETIEITAYVYAPDRSLYRSQVAAARAQLDEADWEAAWAEGRAMTPEEAVEYALSEEEESVPPTAVPEPEQPSAELTRREEEVAVLVARGLTNRQIASELTLSRRTVDNHVANVLKKLTLPSRSHVAAWVEERRPRGTEPN